MKRFVLAFALCAAFWADAAVMKTVRGLQSGEIGAVGAGRIASVEVVSESASGTVALSRVTDVDIFTNAYAVTVSTSSAIQVSSVVTNRFFDHFTNGVLVASYVEDASNFQFLAQSDIVTNRYFDLYVNGKLERIFEEGGTNITVNGIVLKDPLFLKSGAWRILYENLTPHISNQYTWLLVDPDGNTNATALAEWGIGYAKAKEIDFGEAGRAIERIEVVPTSSAAGGKVLYDRDPASMHNFWYLIGGDGSTNASVRAESGVGWRAHNIDFGAAGYCLERVNYVNSYATNTIISTATNGVTPVLKKRLSVTNSVVNGTCSAGRYSATPTNAWMFASDKLIFTGTATGGVLRLVVE